MVEGYGLTESSGVVSANPYTGLRKPGTIGQPIPATQIMLLDKENPDRLAPDGEPGELVFTVREPRSKPVTSHVPPPSPGAPSAAVPQAR